MSPASRAGGRSAGRRSAGRQFASKWSAGRRTATAIAAIGLSLCLAACGSTSSSKSYKGEKQAVAEVISEFQSDATTRNEEKICKEVLAASVREKLKANGTTCEKAIKKQLKQVDSTSITVESIAVEGSTAQAQVKSTVYGKERPGTITLAKEKDSWRISDLSTQGLS
ncbi:MAG TPA: hypothetical protein VGF95_00090 [Solirubrobacteraceae bacterium]